jgi:hypothetical protein
MNSRSISVKLNYRDRDLPSLMAEAQKSIAEKVSFDPKKYRLEWGGEFENQQRAEARFRLILALVLGLMIVLLFAEFGVLRQTLLILGVVPLATLGGLIALHLSGENLNVASGVGFIALFGVSVMNGVIMVANLNRVRDLGGALTDAVLTGASERLRPVLMTAAVATVGMLPAAVATGVGSDVQRSLATVVAGGLIPATLLTLFIVPTLYFVIERWAARRIRATGAQAESGRRDVLTAVTPSSAQRARPPFARLGEDRGPFESVYQAECWACNALRLVYFVMQSLRVRCRICTRRWRISMPSSDRWRAARSFAATAQRRSRSQGFWLRSQRSCRPDGWTIRASRSPATSQSDCGSRNF